MQLLVNGALSAYWPICKQKLTSNECVHTESAAPVSLLWHTTPVTHITEAHILTCKRAHLSATCGAAHSENTTIDQFVGKLVIFMVSYIFYCAINWI